MIDGYKAGVLGVVGRAILPAAGFLAGFVPMEDAREPEPPGKAACSQDWLPHNSRRGQLDFD